MAGEKTGTAPSGGAAGDVVQAALTDALNSEWRVSARFVGFQAPRAWSMPDDRNPGQMRSGSTYRVDVRVPEGTVLMKVPETVYQDMMAARLDFGDRIDIIYGRTVSGGEMRVAPVGFTRA